MNSFYDIKFLYTKHKSTCSWAHPVTLIPLYFSGIYLQSIQSTVYLITNSLFYLKTICKLLALLQPICVVIYLLCRTDRVFYLLTLSPYTYLQRRVFQHKQVTHLNIYMFKRIINYETLLRDFLRLLLRKYMYVVSQYLIHIRYFHTNTYALYRVI